MSGGVLRAASLGSANRLPIQLDNDDTAVVRVGLCDIDFHSSFDLTFYHLFFTSGSAMDDFWRLGGCFSNLTPVSPLLYDYTISID